jgi:hypothetical protein
VAPVPVVWEIPDQTLVVEAKGKEDAKATEAFLDSFALSKPPTP